MEVADGGEDCAKLTPMGHRYCAAKWNNEPISQFGRFSPSNDQKGMNCNLLVWSQRFLFISLFSAWNFNHLCSLQYKWVLRWKIGPCLQKEYDFHNYINLRNTNYVCKYYLDDEPYSFFLFWDVLIFVMKLVLKKEL